MLADAGHMLTDVGALGLAYVGVDGIQFNEHVEDDGQLVFQHAYNLGLEGIVAKRIDLPSRSGRAKCWIKVRSPKSAAMLRIEDGSW